MEYHIVNAFVTNTAHSGNQAAVVPLSKPIPDFQKALIARDFNFSETAFIEPLGPGRWSLRWFTPAIEVVLCGHATLASAAVLFQADPALDRIEFVTRWSGTLIATRDEEGIDIELPGTGQDEVDKMDDNDADRQLALTALQEAVEGFKPESLQRVWIFRNKVTHCIMQVDDSVSVKDMKVQAKPLAKVGEILNIITQVVPSSDGRLHIDSRVFVPGAGIDEDPVTGSAHAYLASYYTSPLVRQSLTADPSIIIARQQSERGGALQCQEVHGRIKIVGKAAIWATGTLHI